jgi:hypothetical protein
MAPPCYRHSWIIGAVFGEIDWLTLPIIYHLRGKTAPIIPLFGSVRLTTFTSSYEVLGLVLTDAFPEWKRVDRSSLESPGYQASFAADAVLLESVLQNP